MALLTSQPVKGVCGDHRKFYSLLRQTMRVFTAFQDRKFNTVLCHKFISYICAEQRCIRASDQLSRRIFCCHEYRKSQNFGAKEYCDYTSNRVVSTRLNFSNNLNFSNFHGKHCSLLAVLKRGFCTGTCLGRRNADFVNHIGSQCFMSSKTNDDSISIDAVSYPDDYESAPDTDTEDEHTDDLAPDDVATSGKVLHIPVMAEEAIDMLEPKNGQLLVDMTFGAGGHTKRILQQAPHARVIALDRDPTAYQLAQKLAEGHELGQIIPLLGRFSELPHLLSRQGIQEESIDGFLFDVGASSIQFDQTERGFSLSSDGPLDMRMDADRNPDQPTAADVVNYIDEHSLYRIIKKYGEEKNARVITHAIIEARYGLGKITRTRQLADIIDAVLNGSYRLDKLRRRSHAATKTFQALRIFVNNELNEIQNGIEVAHHYLKPGGTCAVITFHSLEDRIVKRHFHGIDIDSQHSMSVGDQHRNAMKIHLQDQVLNLMEKRWERLTKRVVVCSDEEMKINPRARSAKLRVARKVAKS